MAILSTLEQFTANDGLNKVLDEILSADEKAQAFEVAAEMWETGDRDQLISAAVKMVTGDESGATEIQSMMGSGGITVMAAGLILIGVGLILIGAAIA